jgi:glycosidase
MTTINQNSIFYHIYPLGACGAPHFNDFQSEPQPRLRQILGWLDHIQSLGANALYLGPVFESGSHGYDTADYFHVDRRLGTRADLAELSNALHARGMHLVLDGVFNHVGRNFWAFRDVQANGQDSPYKNWFADLRFDQRSPHGDPFSYAAWNGHFDLVKLNLAEPSTRQHLFDAILMWKEEFQIDGIRLDAADALSFDFLRELRAFTNQLDPNLWLMGEVIHGDYRQWANPDKLHATTNYELFKSLFSSFNDSNFFELAYSLNREFGTQGIYRDLPTLFNFADNHDVSRIASQLRDKQQLHLLYFLLFTMPGIPSVYYGSEFGFEGVKQSDDWNLRPAFDLPQLQNQAHAHDLRGWIGHLAWLRQSQPALRDGSYEQVLVASQQFAFSREAGNECVVLAVNSASEPAELTLPLRGKANWRFVDLLSPEESFTCDPSGNLQISMRPNQARLLKNG